MVNRFRRQPTPSIENPRITFELLITGIDQENELLLNEYQIPLTEEITRGLLRELGNMSSRDFTVEIIETSPGSITVLFGVLLSAYTVFATYKDFFESINMIRNQVRNLVFGIINRNTRRQIRVKVYVNVVDVQGTVGIGKSNAVMGGISSSRDAFSYFCALHHPIHYYRITCIWGCDRNLLQLICSRISLPRLSHRV
ncbi:MAG: hypothetical protein D6711_09270 [Chloroflexi bacterium]|nr:MAG: hypothetical protein D6711_09270 [Chloroflexota bacterium]